VFSQPIYFAKLTLLKGLLFVGHIKPYYSGLHNLFIACYLYPCYALAIKGFWMLRKRPVVQAMFVFILFQIITVSLTSENWDGRFLLPVLPLVFVFATAGVKDVVKGYLVLGQIY
jgi:hypothetical protein